jgi:hypothetical protein
MTSNTLPVLVCSLRFLRLFADARHGEAEGGEGYLVTLTLLLLCRQLAILYLMVSNPIGDIIISSSLELSYQHGSMCMFSCSRLAVILLHLLNIYCVSLHIDLLGALALILCSIILFPILSQVRNSPIARPPAYSGHHPYIQGRKQIVTNRA